MKIKSKVIVVTGGGNGMGRELVLQLLERGSKVVALDVNQSALEETAKLASEWSDFLSIYPVDITDKEVVETLVETIINELGFIDGIINNAGIIQPFIDLNNLSYDSIEKVFKVNFLGTIYITKSFLPHLLTRPEAHIVNISSMGGFLPVPGQTIYGATKAAVKLMTEGLAQELKQTNVRVSVVFPGAVGTNIMQNSGVTMPGLGDAKVQKSGVNLSPKNASKKIIDKIEKNQERIFIGKDAIMMNLLYRINARFASDFIGKQMNKILK
ncbi:SDR family NAD(P)-dependent oxidoreductase [Flavobacterium daejeonense]|uniref:SDR family NAD(P)-dependent oxidoreductase n=1 Tax=Flavobacterium daejeonense TaxID=350893 RepID=UPI0004788A8A|nr:SDR family NAD(P)-dependent oxidoreductase [Flavobacterium daejeonense]